MSSVWEGDHWGEYVWLTGDLCIDNNVETKCHTKGDETWPWVAVEIPQSRVEQVNIVNRHDCCGERTKNVKVWVGNTLPTTTDTEYSQGTLLGQFKGPGTNRQVIPFSSSRGLEGKYVIVQMTGTDYINLGEIEVFGVPGCTDTRDNIPGGTLKVILGLKEPADCNDKCYKFPDRRCKFWTMRKDPVPTTCRLFGYEDELDGGKLAYVSGVPCPPQA